MKSPIIFELCVSLIIYLTVAVVFCELTSTHGTEAIVAVALALIFKTIPINALGAEK